MLLVCILLRCLQFTNVKIPVSDISHACGHSTSSLGLWPGLWYGYFYCLMAGSNVYMFYLMNYVDIGHEQNQIKDGDYVVVDLVGSQKQQNMMETLNQQQRTGSSNIILNTPHKICSELSLYTKWWMILIIIIKFWSLNVNMCITDKEDTMNSVLCNHWNLKWNELTPETNTK